jgi:hypothetical protein
MEACLSLLWPELEVGLGSGQLLLFLGAESKLAEPGFDPGTFGL